MDRAEACGQHRACANIDKTCPNRFGGDLVMKCEKRKTELWQFEQLGNNLFEFGLTLEFWCEAFRQSSLRFSRSSLTNYVQVEQNCFAEILLFIPTWLLRCEDYVFLWLMNRPLICDRVKINELVTCWYSVENCLSLVHYTTPRCCLMIHDVYIDRSEVLVRQLEFTGLFKKMIKYHGHTPKCVLFLINIQCVM